MRRIDRDWKKGLTLIELAMVFIVGGVLLAFGWPFLRERGTALLAEELRGAMGRSDRDAVLKLLRIGAPPDAWSGQTPHYCLRCKAIQDGDLEMLRLAFPPGAYTPETFPRHRPPFLTQAVMRDDLEMASALLDAGAPATRIREYTLYRNAQGHYEPIRINTLGQRREDALVRLRASRTVRLSPLGVAIADKNLPMVKLLLRQMTRETLQAPDDPEKGFYTLLHTAAATGDTELVALLLDNGVRVNGRNYDGDTALHVAARNCDRAVVALLLEHGADAALWNAAGHTAADDSPTACRAEIAALLEAGAPSNSGPAGAGD